MSNHVDVARLLGLPSPRLRRKDMKYYPTGRRCPSPQPALWRDFLSCMMWLLFSKKCFALLRPPIQVVRQRSSQLITIKAELSNLTRLMEGSLHAKIPTSDERRLAIAAHLNSTRSKSNKYKIFTAFHVQTHHTTLYK